MPNHKTVNCPHCHRGPFEVHRGLTGHIRQSPACYQKELESLVQPYSDSASSDTPEAPSPRSESPLPPADPLPRAATDTQPDGTLDGLTSEEESNSRPSRLNPPGPWSTLPRDPTREPTVGAFRGTLWEQRKAREDPAHPYYPWASLHEFRTVQWLSTEGLSQGAINRYLVLQKVRGKTSSKRRHTE